MPGNRLLKSAGEEDVAAFKGSCHLGGMDLKMAGGAGMADRLVSEFVLCILYLFVSAQTLFMELLFMPFV